MFQSTQTFIDNSPSFATEGDATKAACALEIACWLKGCGFDVRRAVEAVEAIAPRIEAAIAGGPGTLIVLAIDGRGLRATVSADDATLNEAVEAADRAGLALLGINPALIADIVKEAHCANANAIH